MDLIGRSRVESRVDVNFDESALINALITFRESSPPVHFASPRIDLSFSSKYSRRFFWSILEGAVAGSLISCLPFEMCGILPRNRWREVHFL